MAKKTTTTSPKVRRIVSNGDALVETSRGDIFIKPTQIFIDSFSGSVEFEQLYGERSNVNFLIRQFKNDPAVQSRIGDFYRSLKFNHIMQNLIQANQTKPADVHFTATALTAILVTEGGLQAEDAIVVADQLVPLLRHAGFSIATPEKYMTRAVHGRALVTVEDLKRDVAAQHCAQIMDRTKINSVGTNRYSKTVLGEIVSLDLRAAGARMLSQASYGKVVDDAVIAVRANLDIENEQYRFAVPEWLRTHSVIEELATNLTFVTAAFSSDMPSAPTLSVDTEDMKKYLDVLAASLKSSTRYRCVTIKSLLEEYTLKHGFDYNEELAFATIAHNVQYETGIMAAMPTFMDEEVAYLDRTDSRVAELLMAHDQGLFSINAAANAVHTTFEMNVSDPDYWPVDSEPYVHVIDTEEEFLRPEVLIALATAERVALRRSTDAAGRDTFLVGEGEDTGGSVLPDFVYYVQNDGKRLPMKLRNRMLDRNFLITSDPASAVLLAKPFESKRAKNASKQLPGDDVYGARLLGVEADIVQKLNHGVEYSLAVGSHQLAGKFYLKSIDSLRTSASQGVLINPVNGKVTDAITKALYVALDSSGDLRRKFAYNSVIYQFVIDMADRLSKAFREDVHQRIVAQALQNVLPEESAAMRSTYNRSVFAAQVDMFALKLYLEAIGCVDAARTIGELSEDEGMQMAMAQRGSSRRNGK